MNPQETKQIFCLEYPYLLELEFEGLPPTVNMMYRGLRGHRYKTEAALTFSNQISDKLSLIWGDREPITDRLELHIEFYTHSHKRWDIDNRVKALQDCLAQAGVIKDDSQIDLLRVERKYITERREYTKIKLLAYNMIKSYA